MINLIINELTVCGVDAQSSELTEVINSAEVILARGRVAADWLQSIGAPSGRIHMTSEDLSGEVGKGLYVTRVVPIAVDLTAQGLVSHASAVRMIPGHDALESLTDQYVIPSGGSLQVLDGLALLDRRYPPFSPAAPAVIYLDDVDLALQHLVDCLLQVYPATHIVYLYHGQTLSNQGWHETQVDDLVDFSHLEMIYLPPISPDASLEGFMQVIAKLRAPDGCPWDRKQTHASLRQYLLEETYEALERLDQNDLEGLKEELGDLLLQIALHAEIATESGTFTISEVLQGINSKIVSRHPHIFSSVTVRDEKDVIQNWEKIKEAERAENGKSQGNGLLDGIPAILPALSQAQSLQERAARVGFDWPDIQPVIAKVIEEFREVQEAVDNAARAEELGDLLFAAVNLVRWHGVDAETALRGTNAKFRRRFAYIESEARAAGKEQRNMTLEEMDIFWEAAKKIENPDNGKAD